MKLKFALFAAFLLTLQINAQVSLLCSPDLVIWDGFKEETPLEIKWQIADTPIFIEEDAPDTVMQSVQITALDSETHSKQHLDSSQNSPLSEKNQKVFKKNRQSRPTKTYIKGNKS